MPDDDDREQLHPVLVEQQRVRLSTFSSRFLPPVHIMIQIEPCKPAAEALNRTPRLNP